MPKYYWNLQMYDGPEVSHFLLKSFLVSAWKFIFGFRLKFHFWFPLETWILDSAENFEFWFPLKIWSLVSTWNLYLGFCLKFFSAQIFNFGFRLKFEFWFPPKIWILISACYACFPPRIILVSFRINMTVGNSLNATLTCQSACFIVFVRIWK